MLLYTPDMVYQLDQAAVKQDGISEVELMRRAGESVWREISCRWPQISKITVFAGAGNNGGDAFVVALCARAHAVEVQLLVQGDLSKQSETSRHFTNLWCEGGGETIPWQQQLLTGELIVDGLLGIGLKRELDKDFQALIQSINGYQVPRVAIDIPSGLNGLTGNPQPLAVDAALTVTFIGIKTGHKLAQGPDHCGELIFEDLGISTAARQSVPASLAVIDNCRLPALRKKDSHKNHFGHLLVIGGNQGMSGAVTLAARAALRSGVGMVTALVHPQCQSHLSLVPEVMVHAWGALESMISRASIILVGPGLGTDAETTELMQLLQKASQPMVIDADALHADFLNSVNSSELVITPHPGEAARLLGCSTADIQQDRIASCRQLVDKFGASCVLKGSGSLVASDKAMEINTRGNAGMASAGMGDVLSGIIAALMGQGLDPYESARTAVYLHAICAEEFAIEHDQIGLMASDIIETIPRVLKQLRSGSL
jgi:hydroxyethylthiazole kinase-like uncharacterized protein yjeF